MNLAELYLVSERIRTGILTLDAGLKQLEKVAEEAKADFEQLRELVLAVLDPPIPVAPPSDLDFIVENGDIFGEMKARGLHLNPTVTIGVRGYGGALSIGTGYNDAGSVSGDINLRLVGLTENASVSIRHLGDQYGFVDNLQLTSLGIQGLNDSFIVRQTGEIGDLELDGCWWITNPEYSGTQCHTSAITLPHGFRNFVQRNHKWRGAFFREHNNYPKGGGSILLEDNELEGYNRTGMQVRPHIAYGNQPESPAMEGDITLRGNIARNEEPHPLGASGGQWLTVWNCLNGTVTFDGNKCLNSKYGCFGAIGQPEYKAHRRPDGYQINRVVFQNNIGDNPDSDRHNTEFSSCRDVVIGHGNKLIAKPGRFPLVLVSKWAQENLDFPHNGSVRVLPGAMRPEEIGRWDVEFGRYVQATEGIDYHFTENIGEL